MFQDYNMDDVVLPIDLERKLPENDIAKTVNQFIENIPDEAFKPFLRKTGKPAYHPRMMMKMSYVPTRNRSSLVERLRLSFMIVFG